MFAIFKDTAWVIVSQLAGRGLLFLAGAAIAWRLGRDVFAEFSYLALTSAALTTYFAMGAGTAITRYASANAQDAGPERGRNIAAAGCIGLIGGLAAMLLIATLPALFLPGSVAQLQLPLIVALCAQLTANLVTSMLMGERNFAATALANVGSGLLLVVVTASALALHSLVLVIWSIPLSQLAFLLLALRAAAPRLRQDFAGLRLRSVVEAMPAALRFSGPVFVLSVFATTGPWALGMLLLRISKQEFAAYSAGLQWFSLILVVPGALSMAYLPRLFSAASGGGSAAAASATPSVTTNMLQSLAIAAATALVAIPLANVLILFHGEVLRDHKSVFVAFVLAAVASAAVVPLGNGMVARNRQMTWLWLTGFWLMTLVVIAWSIPVTTALLAAVDLGVGYVLLLLVALWVSRRQLHDT